MSTFWLVGWLSCQLAAGYGIPVPIGFQLSELGNPRPLQVRGTLRGLKERRADLLWEITYGLHKVADNFPSVSLIEVRPGWYILYDKLP